MLEYFEACLLVRKMWKENVVSLHPVFGFNFNSLAGKNTAIGEGNKLARLRIH